MNIRKATENDFDVIWPIFNEIVSAGETYAYPEETTKGEALKIWMQLPRKTYVAEEDNDSWHVLYKNQSGWSRKPCM